MRKKSRTNILKSNPYIDLKKQWISQNIEDYITSMEKSFKASRASIEDKIDASFALMTFQLLGVPSEHIPLKLILEKSIALGRTYIKKLPQYWHNRMLVVMNASLILGEEKVVSDFANWFRPTRFQKVATHELLATIPVLFQIANLCRSKGEMDLRGIFDELDKWKIRPDSALQHAIQGIRIKKPDMISSNVVKSGTRASAKINSVLQTGGALSTFIEHLLSHALIWNCAVFKGISLDLPPHLHPFMITRQSLGLPTAVALPNTQSPRRFEFGSSKFWTIILDGESFTVTFGKLGTAGQSRTKTFATPAVARKEYDKLVAEKINKGYVECK